MSAHLIWLLIFFFFPKLCRTEKKGLQFVKRRLSLFHVQLQVNKPTLEKPSNKSHTMTERHMLY